MFLKYLDIFGFKSFADRTQIEFADGITALLGPNGCGKSNVVDAVKWVLGEQAARSLRAEKMEDVIFNGTESRKALNVAEVTLTITNDEGLLPLDKPEIEIRRRLYRSGESEYYINGSPVRLKEVREMFWDTGVGKASYSVMEQGKIDQVLSSKPEERRYLFEEAAGITRYKIRSAETQRKLEKTEDNMRQVEGIMGEVKRSYDSLKNQSEKTLVYRSLRDEIFHLELDIQLLRLKASKTERDSKNEELNQKRSRRDEVRAQMEGISKSLEENLDAVHTLEEKLVEYQKNIYGLSVEKTAREKEARLLSEQSSQHRAKIGQNEERDRAAALRISELREDAGTQDEEVKKLLRQTADIEANIASFEENIRLSTFRITENDKLVHEKEGEIKKLDLQRAELEKDLQEITDDIVAALDAGLREAGYSAQERRSCEAELGSILGRIRQILSAPDSINIQETLSLTDKALELFEQYKKTTPSFIDEFVAPEGIITKKREIDSAIRTGAEGVIQRRDQIAQLRLDNEDLSRKIDQYRATLEELRVNRARMDAQARAAEEQARLLRRELAGQEGLQQHIQSELKLDRIRLEELANQIAGAESDIIGIEKRGEEFETEQKKLENDIRLKNGETAGKQETLKTCSIDLDRIIQSMEKTQLNLAQIEADIKNIQENFRETHSRDLQEFENRIHTISASPAELREKLAATRAKLKELGSVNLMAPEEFEETKERYEFLAAQMEDLSKARLDLHKMTAEIRHESSQMFLATYNQIKKNFHNMFRRLFGGGRGELRLADPNHILESGIEIFAQPPGKKLEIINLLSGGERSLTAVALLFATYMVKPSPFCLLDEIDATLDEANVGRFVHLLREFGKNSQFIVITHNKKTVTGANTLLGMTMEESGITKLISLRLADKDQTPIQRQSESKEIIAFEEEDVEYEDGRELPSGIDNPEAISESDLRPILGAK